MAQSLKRTKTDLCLARPHEILLLETPLCYKKHLEWNSDATQKKSIARIELRGLVSNWFASPLRRCSVKDMSRVPDGLLLQKREDLGNSTTLSLMQSSHQLHQSLELPGCASKVILKE
jgi:hypothetical protein